MKFGWGSDHRLVRRAIGGDRSAAERLVRDHYSDVVRFLLHLTNNIDEAQELAQETFVRAWRALDTFAGGSSFKTWIHSIAYREFLAETRARARFTTGMESSELTLPDFSAGVVDAIVLQSALQTLPEEQRAALLLVHVQGLTVTEAAIVLEIPRGTVMSRVAAARKRVGQILEQDEKKDRRFDSNPLEGGASYEIQTLSS